MQSVHKSIEMEKRTLANEYRAFKFILIFIMVFNCNQTTKYWSFVIYWQRFISIWNRLTQKEIRLNWVRNLYFVWICYMQCNSCVRIVHVIGTLWLVKNMYNRFRIENEFILNLILYIECLFHLQTTSKWNIFRKENHKCFRSMLQKQSIELQKMMYSFKIFFLSFFKFI